MEENFPEEFQNFLLTLPKEKGWPSQYLYQYQGFWNEARLIRATRCAQNNFQAQDTDIILVTQPKAGTTWLKALAFAIANRTRFSTHDNNHPLLKSRPHDLVPYLELHLYLNPDKLPDLSTTHDSPSSTPRLFATHLPYSLLPESIKTSRCRIVCLYRNPFDVFVSFYHFLIPMRPKSLGPLSFEDAFDMYSRGLSPFGPFWDHVLEYWEKSKENSEKMLFLKYEDMKEDIRTEAKKLAEFMGFPFTTEEEKGKGVMDDIISLCSFDTLKESEHSKVEKISDDPDKFDSKKLYRKGQVGDWANYFTPSMTETLNKIVDDKFHGCGLKFKSSIE